jgi:hypothetical protein
MSKSNVVQMRLPDVSKVPHPRATAGIPTEKDIHRIPLARAGEYELTDKETKQLRVRIYSLNKNNAAGRRWRTMRDGNILMVWRIS